MVRRFALALGGLVVLGGVLSLAVRDHWFWTVRTTLVERPDVRIVEVRPASVADVGSNPLRTGVTWTEVEGGAFVQHHGMRLSELAHQAFGGEPDREVRVEFADPPVRYDVLIGSEDAGVDEPDRILREAVLETFDFRTDVATIERSVVRLEFGGSPLELVESNAIAGRCQGSVSEGRLEMRGCTLHALAQYVGSVFDRRGVFEGDHDTRYDLELEFEDAGDLEYQLRERGLALVLFDQQVEVLEVRLSTE